jgi:predicted TIM-barrel fold metal-dependent hydrolase
LKKFLDRGGADRLLWGTDVQAPYFLDLAPSGLQGTINDNIIAKQLDELGASEEQKAGILGDNAARIFGC